MSKDKKSKKTGEKPVQRAQSMDICFSNDPINKEMTEECRESLLKDPLNQFSNDQINNIVQVVGNKDNVTLDISIEDIPEGKQGIFYKLLLNYIEAKKLRDSIFIRHRHKGGWKELPFGFLKDSLSQSAKELTALPHQKVESPKSTETMDKNEET